jgi:hypothetical protein
MLRPLLARVRGPWPAGDEPLTFCEPEPLPYLRLLCGFAACEELGTIHRLDGARRGWSSAVAWGVTLPGDFAEVPPGSGHWRPVRRIRRARTTLYATSDMRPFRTRDGALFASWPRMKTEGNDAPAKPMWMGRTHHLSTSLDGRGVGAALTDVLNERTFHAPSWRGAQSVGALGISTPPELIIVCRLGHASHLTVAHIEQEAEQLRQSLRFAIS